jgi:hypothetical protein
MKLSLYLVEVFPVFTTNFLKRFNQLKLFPCSIIKKIFIHICLSSEWKEDLSPYNKCLIMTRIFNTTSRHVNRSKRRGWMLKNMKVNMNKKKFIELTISWVLLKFQMLMIVLKIIFHLLKEEVLFYLVSHPMISTGLIILYIIL